jgi:hypothetical protein
MPRWPDFQLVSATGSPGPESDRWQETLMTKDDPGALEAHRSRGARARAA